MSTFLLVKANNEWAVFSQLQKNSVEFHTEDIQEVHALNESVTEAAKTFQTISQSDFPEPDFSKSFCIATTWPAVGQAYYFLAMPNPFDIVVQQGIITEELLEEYNENKSGNIFETHSQASEAARKLTRFFDNANTTENCVSE